MIVVRMSKSIRYTWSRPEPQVFDSMLQAIGTQKDAVALAVRVATHRMMPNDVNHKLRAPGIDEDRVPQTTAG